MNQQVGLGVLTPPPDLLDDQGRSRRGEDTAPYLLTLVRGHNTHPELEITASWEQIGFRVVKRNVKISSYFSLLEYACRVR